MPELPGLQVYPGCKEVISTRIEDLSGKEMELMSENNLDNKLDGTSSKPGDENLSADEQKKRARHELYLKQKALLDTFLEKKAITQAQYDKSFHDLTEKMGEGPS